MWNTNTLNKWMGLMMLIAALFILHQLFHIHSILKMPMGSLHTWRQADCISVTNEMYNGTGTLFYPTTHYIKSDGTRYAAGELPIINQLVATIYKTTGPDTSVYRTIIYTFYWIGLVFLYLIFYEISRQWLNSVLLTLLLGTSSVLLFYATNFLPDVPALSIAIVGLYFWLNARKNNKLFTYLFSISLMVLACLVKITLCILLGSVMMVLLVEWIMHERRKIHFPVLMFIGFGSVLIAAWYYHAYQLDHQHPPFIFLTETRSFFETFYLERPLVWKEVRETWLPQVYVPVVWCFLLGGPIVSLVFSKTVKIEQMLLCSCAISGGLLVFFFLYRQFLLHDYLWVTLLIIPMILAIVMIQGVSGVRSKHLKASFALAMIGLIPIQGLQTSLILKQRYFQFETNWVYNPNLAEMNEELRKHGIKKTDPVISVQDNSPNITLLLMDQYGFTLYRNYTKEEKWIEQKIKTGAKYLMVTNPSELAKPYIQPFLVNPFFTYKDISVYKLVK